MGGIGGLYPEPAAAGIIHELTCEQMNKQVSRQSPGRQSFTKLSRAVSGTS